MILGARRLPRSLRTILSRGAVLAFAAAAVANGSSADAAVAAHGDTVNTRSGPVQGTTIGRMRAFLGIPYAAPPVGLLRWRPPHPHARWTGPLQATTFANHCPQPASPYGTPSLTEDCLYLNVFTPAGASRGAQLPVMVWIHGGALVVGESNDYDPQRLVARGVIVVTLNYRLGRLGFFAQSGLDAEDHKRVNYGLMDQQSALNWVKNNVAAFGGNPERTTIFGESAGGLSVFSQLASPTARGLFNGAIVESGAYALTLPSLAASEAQGNAAAIALHCPNQQPGCLRSLGVAQAIAGVPNEGATTVPTIDGTVLTQSPSTAFASGNFNRVPVVDGSNHDEYRLFVASGVDLVSGPLSAAAYPFVVAQTVGPAAAPRVLNEYPLSKYASPDLALAALETDAVFACNALGADASLARYVPLFAYEFADENAPEPFLPPVSFPYGAAHASEIQFLFDSFTKPNPPLTAAEHTLADTMVNDWTNFAKARAPWPLFAPAGTMERFVPPAPYLWYTFAPDHHCGLWASLAKGG